MSPVVVVNDIHSELNETSVTDVVPVSTTEAVCDAVRRAARLGAPVAVAGGRHAMGGQQFCTDGLLLDTRPLERILGLDRERGLLRVEAGVQWPALLDWLHETQDDAAAWAFRQKQTGADRLSIGGAIAANVHGRGLTMAPFVSDVEEMSVVDPEGALVTCSRAEHPDLFALVTGGYGLFGCVVDASLRLVRRTVLERVVEVIEIDGLAAALEQRIADGFLYGDFQFATDPRSDDLLRRGVFSCYRPVEHDGPLPSAQRVLHREDWTKLIALAHTDKSRAFEVYAQHYLATSGQLYHSDSHQMADYEDGYHHALDAALGASHAASEMISELYVPRARLAGFMADVADDVRAHGIDIVYGTIRLIERDDETFLPWAREPWACVIFNVHTEHSPDGIERSASSFRRLIDRAIDHGGSYYLTYHRWATREQVERCHPRFVDFLRRKLELDPAERFQSDWYRHYRGMFAAELGLAR